MEKSTTSRRGWKIFGVMLLVLFAGAAIAYGFTLDRPSKRTHYPHRF